MTTRHSRSNRSVAASILGLSIAGAISFAATEASATNYTLWIHGRSPGNSYNKVTYQDFGYWGPSSTAAGVNKRAVNWDGQSSISASNGGIRNALDCYCTGTNSCYIAAHSAGDLQIGYALAMFGTSSRKKKNATPNSSGVCGDVDGTSQTGWNIKWIDVAAGAGGGSELANIGQVFTGNAIDTDLKTSNARALYNHNTTQGKWMYRFAGASGTLYAAYLPGQDDEAVSYHSAGGVSATGGFCNPADWLCNDLKLGTSATEGGTALWSFQNVDFRDDNEAYNHYSNGNWAGIIGPARSDIVAYAL